MTDIQKIWSDTYRVHTYEVDAEGRMSLPVLGSLLQESASRHANHLGWGYEVLTQKNCIWVLTALKIEMVNDAHWNDEVIIQTWPSGKNRLYYFRDFNIQTSGAKTLGKATTNWIMIDMDSRRPASAEIPEPFDYTQMNALFNKQPRKWPVPGNLSKIRTIQVQFDDLDINNHVNNIRYVDWMLRSLNSPFRKSYRLCEFEIHFTAEATDQDNIQVWLGQNKNAFEHLLIREKDNKAVAQALSVWESAGHQL
ncbi:hypothetical protein JW835_15255 [bacterium]|nr:hypothetical protein [bacterium]